MTRHGSLFSGYGGLDMAIEEVLGAHTVWVSDIDPGARKVLAYHYPDVPNLGDITAVDWATVEPVDIISGGSPCQDLSHAGKRAGMTDGTRSNLWVAMREAIAVLRPRFVVWENVRGAYSACADSAADSVLGRCPRCLDPDSGSKHAPNLRALGRVLGDLSDLGYDAVWVGLRAADVGAPHGRFRVFVIAADTRSESRLEWGLSAPGQAQGRGSFGELAGRDRAPLGLLPTSRATRGGSSTETTALLPTPSASAFNDGEDLDQWEARRQRVALTAANSNGFGTPLGVAVRLIPTPSVADAMGGHERRGGARGDELLLKGIGKDPALWGQYAVAIARWESVTCPAPDPTEPGKHGQQRLAARFAEWMMGCPDGWITDVPDVTRNEALKLAGNGVVRQQAVAAIRYALPLLLGRAA